MEQQAEQQQGVLQPLKLLIAEDSENDALLLIMELEIAGFKPEYCLVDNSADMRAALERKDWDIIITDHNMPQFSSTEAIALVKDCGIETPIIIVSGSIGENIAVEAMKSGAQDYIMKNNMMRLVPAIRRELGESQTRKANREAQQVIHHMACYDELTGLLNRREFEHHLDEAILTAREGDLVHALIYMDLDQFKIINDTCGHLAGDNLLLKVKDEIQELLRDIDIFARLGGDEFGILLESCPLYEAEEIAESIRNTVKNILFEWKGKTFTTGISIGLVVITSQSNDVSELTMAADVACYAAKESGRNRVQLYNKSDSSLAKHQGEILWVSRINQALAENRFVLYKQQIQPLQDNGEHVHIELLIRMIDEEDNIISPDHFIPSAERYNLMSSLDRWIIKTAFEYISDNVHGTLNDDSMVSINLSGLSLGDATLIEYIHELLVKHSLPENKVCFEVTETAAVSNVKHAQKFIQYFRNLGCAFSLDDFGSGLCSFTYLKTMPVDFLKIDGGFVRNMLNNSMDRAIVSAIHQIGQAAGLKTIAEFVENESIKDCLQELGVDYGQGYALHKPEPLEK